MRLGKLDARHEEFTARAWKFAVRRANASWEVGRVPRRICCAGVESGAVEKEYITDNDKNNVPADKSDDVQKVMTSPPKSDDVYVITFRRGRHHFCKSDDVLVGK